VGTFIRAGLLCVCALVQAATARAQAGLPEQPAQTDVWLRAAVVDRGDLAVPASVLPILDGGFDQQQLTLGVTYRSEERDPDFGL